MVDPETENAWEIAAQLEQLLENGRSAMLIGRPDMTSIEWRAALIAVVSRIIVRHGPLTIDLERQADAFRRSVLDEMRRARSRQRAQGDAVRLMTEYESRDLGGPDVA